MGHWENAGVPDNFDGIVRLFPLPNMVLFPHVVQALHIFEPRYCEMLTEALEADHLITMALLLPGWESSSDENPAIGQIACIGRIVSHTPTDDGHHNILLAGLKRVRIVRELDVSTPFRQAEVEILEEPYSELNDFQIQLYRSNLLKVFRSFMPKEASDSKSFGELLTSQLPLGILIDVVSYAVNLPSQTKLAILSELDIVSRYQLLMDHLGSPEFEELVEGSMADNSDPANAPKSPHPSASTKLDSEEDKAVPQWPNLANKPKGIFPPPFSEN